MINKPHVDWIRIIWKVQGMRKWSSRVDTFAICQCMDFTAKELIAWHKLQETNRVGHKHKRPWYKEYEDVAKYGDLSKWRQRGRSYSNPPTDLSCDDPYYDGVPVIDI